MISQSIYNQFANNPKAFRDSLMLDVDGVVKQFGECVDEWQESDFQALDQGLLRCTNRKHNHDAKLRFYLERARGHSKTTDLAIACLWLLLFAPRMMRTYCYASDRDQAMLLRDAMARITRLNTWMNDIIKVNKDHVLNIARGHPGYESTLKIETSDVGSSYGILPDAIIADEFSHWQGDGGLWNSLISSAAKKSNCLMLSISNAGFVDSWQWKIREAIRTDEDWYFSRLDGPKASWMSEKRLDEQRRMLPSIAYQRLWLNEWSSGGGDALTTEDIDAAFSNELHTMSGKERDWEFVAGVDLGLVRDCSAVCVLGIGKHGTPNQDQIRLAQHKLWRPTPGKKINLTDVELYVRELDQQFKLTCCAYDPWQSEHLAQRVNFIKRQYNTKPESQFMQPIQPSGSNLRDQASLTIETFGDRRFKAYNCQPLKTDLHKLRVEEKSYGYRLTSPRDESGHGDLFSAFALALFVASKQAGQKRLITTCLTDHGRDPFEVALEEFNRRKLLFESQNQQTEFV